jgi:outer membrane protein OmpA-like peptidoglycan-associated protein
MPEEVRAKMEAAFGVDFSPVRIHEGPHAEAVGALAYTRGTDIHFAPAQYQPTSRRGQELLGHELMHVVQQSQGRVRATAQAKGVAINDDVSLEREADEIGARAARGDVQTLALPKVAREGKRVYPDLAQVALQSSGAAAATAVQRSCGEGAIGTVSGCTGVSGDIHGREFLFDVGCDTLRTDTTPNEATRLRNEAALIPDGITAAIHGYASEEGSDRLNENLSCARAVVARNILSAELATLGKSASFHLYKHGATPGPRPLRRSVVISYTQATPAQEPAPVTEPGPTPALTIVPCTTLPRQILHRPGGCSGGADFAFSDHPTLSWGDAAKVAFARVSTDFALLNNMRTELGILAGSEGFRMVSHFASGSGATLTHGPTTPIGSRALAAPSFHAMRRAAETDLERQLTGMAASGTVDCNALTLASSAVPWLSFSLSADGPMLKGIIGGTQGLTVWLQSFSVAPGTRNYMLELRYYICDDFGVDTSDLYSPALISFWVLQHERSGFVPFMNGIDLTVTRGGTF